MANFYFLCIDGTILNAFDLIFLIFIFLEFYLSFIHLPLSGGLLL